MNRCSFALPYRPLPTKLVSAVMPEMIAGEGESSEDFAERVRDSMQAGIHALTAHRTPLLGSTTRQPSFEWLALSGLPWVPRPKISDSTAFHT